MKLMSFANPVLRKKFFIEPDATVKSNTSSIPKKVPCILCATFLPDRNV